MAHFRRAYEPQRTSLAVFRVREKLCQSCCQPRASAHPLNHLKGCPSRCSLIGVAVRQRWPLNGSKVVTLSVMLSNLFRDCRLTVILPEYTSEPDGRGRIVLFLAESHKRITLRCCSGLQPQSKVHPLGTAQKRRKPPGRLTADRGGCGRV